MPVIALLATLVAQSLMGGLPIDGVQCERSEGAVEHVHAYLQLYNHGKPVVVPENIGIVSTAGCLYWIHTHSGDGYIHIESPVVRPFTLGQFFDIWGADLSWTQASSMASPHGQKLSIWVNGKPWHGKDPRTIVLADHEAIVIQNGPPFAKPKAADWSKM